MSDLLSASDLKDINNVFKDLRDTFAKKPAVIRKRVTTQSTFGEKESQTTQDYSLGCLLEFSPGLGGRYHNVEVTERGQEEHPAWRVYFFLDDLIKLGLTKGQGADLQVLVDTEADSVILDGTEFEIRMGISEAFFDTLGPVLWGCDIYDKNRP